MILLSRGNLDWSAPISTTLPTLYNLSRQNLSYLLVCTHTSNLDRQTKLIPVHVFSFVLRFLYFYLDSSYCINCTLRKGLAVMCDSYCNNVAMVHIVHTSKHAHITLVKRCLTFASSTLWWITNSDQPLVLVPVSSQAQKAVEWETFWSICYEQVLYSSLHWYSAGQHKCPQIEIFLTNQSLELL